MSVIILIRRGAGRLDARAVGRVRKEPHRPLPDDTLASDLRQRFLSSRFPGRDLTWTSGSVADAQSQPTGTSHQIGRAADRLLPKLVRDVNDLEE